jgi:Rrf2 family protein
VLSVSCKASIKAVIYLGSQLPKGQRADIKTIAISIHENEHTVGKILQRLVKAKIINSLKGPTGGFFISETQKKLPLMSVVRAIDGNDVFIQCGLGFERCSDSHPCPFHKHYKKVRGYFKEMSESNTIEDLCNDLTAGNAFLSKV